MSLQARKPLKALLSLTFNQDAGCFCCGLDSGFRVYTTEPFTESYSRDFSTGGGVAVAEMLFRSNILALVGGGPIPKYPPNKVMIWDDHQGRAIGELLFKTPVRAVKLRKDRIAVALEHKVYLYDLEDLRLVHQTETCPNPEGLLALAPAADCTVLACPGLHAGQVRVDQLDTRRSKHIEAHNSPLAALALAHNGKLVATASEKGTLIRVFSCADGSKLRELRRGSDPSQIFSLTFCRGDAPEWLAATSDKGTAHVFSLTNRDNNSGGGSGRDAPRGQEAAVGSPAKSGGGGGGRLMMKSLSSLSKFVPSKVGGAYLASDRSWAQYRLPDGHRCLVAFGKDPSTLMLASVTGAFHRATFSLEKKGPCEPLAYNIFMEEEGEPPS